LVFFVGSGVTMTVRAHEGLHFTHPIIAESPSPDTKARVDYLFRNINDNGQNVNEHGVNFEGEYAFNRSFSIEVDTPYTVVDPKGAASMSHLGTVGLSFKFANFAFEDHGILLGYGLEFGLPTGDEERGIGSDHLVDIEPFFDIGYKRDNLEVVAFTSFGIPINQNQGEAVETEMGYNLSFLYHLNHRFAGILEFDGHTILSGPEDGASVVNITPGFKVKPTHNDKFELGAGVSLPLTNTREFDVRAKVSAFYHF